MKAKVVLFLSFLMLPNSVLHASAEALTAFDGRSAEEFLANQEPSYQRADEIKIALIGDTDAGTGFGSVLKLIATEKPNAVMINGDLGYNSSPDAWKSRLTASIDTNLFPVIGTLGNHDVGSNTNKYVTIFGGLRTEKNGLKAACTGTGSVAQG
ncbi:MAG: metallophosphoesterase, partial [Bdellovibrionia bacterium]